VVNVVLLISKTLTNSFLKSYCLNREIACLRR